MMSEHGLLMGTWQHGMHGSSSQPKKEQLLPRHGAREVELLAFECSFFNSAWLSGRQHLQSKPLANTLLLAYRECSKKVTPTTPQNPAE
jgi:hypothetical protein